MSAVELDLTLEGLAAADKRISRLDPIDAAALLEGLARLIQEQTRRRIEEEKTAPDGTAWKPNLAGTPILYKSGALARAIDYLVSGHEATVGVGAIGGVNYPAVHQDGMTIKPKNGKALKFWWASGGFVNFAVVSKVTIPKRQYLGISTANENEILETTVEFIRRKLG